MLLAAIGVLVLGGFLALLLDADAHRATRIGVATALAGALLGLAALVEPLLTGSEFVFRRAWSVPYGSLRMVVDPLAAFFLFVTFLLSPLAAWFGASRLLTHPERRLGPPWFFFQLLVASIALVLVAGNAILFLVAWEIMTIASFFLVTFEDERLEVRRAGWMYLIAAHLGTAFLLVFFVLLGISSGSFDLESAATAPLNGTVAPGLLFAFALLGFGTKAGLVPLHVWLPEAHPAAPSHVSAVMSGVMIATGIYGILRALLLIGPLPTGWGEALIVIGAVTAVVGVLFALAQSDVKRVLAYSSVENMGIVLLGVGAGVLGMSHGAPLLAQLGFGAALLHVLNHACFKGLLFLGTGTLRHATGTLDIDRLGGLIRTMPRSGAAILVGSAAIIGLPPLNGFASEFLTFVAGLHIARDLPVATRWSGIVLVVSLATVGGLAAATFVKTFGAVYLGKPRGERAKRAHEVSASMRAPMYVLAAACVVLGLAPLLGIRIVSMAVARLTNPAFASDSAMLFGFGRLLSIAATAVTAPLLLVGLARWALVRRREKRSADTWGCGYAEPLPRAQYTASSLVAPLVSFMRPVLPSDVMRVAPPHGYFPVAARLQARTADVFTRRMYGPSFVWFGGLFRRLRAFQHGRLHWYLLYIFVTLLLLLFVEFGR